MAHYSIELRKKNMLEDIDFYRSLEIYLTNIKNNHWIQD